MYREASDLAMIAGIWNTDNYRPGNSDSNYVMRITIKFDRYHISPSILALSLENEILSRDSDYLLCRFMQ
jgi:hypothetical protein